VLCAAGFTDRVLAPPEQVQLLASGIGITNLVDRATTGAADLSSAELRAGADVLEDKVRALSPKVVAFLGMQAYRLAFRRPRAAVGLQGETLGPASVWLLPNPSGLQARYQLPELVTMFGELHRFAMAG
jgi:TDG/mug DNA glycosylase family protein